jgi:hypothetical protein
MIIKSHDTRIDEKTVIRIDKDKQPELFYVLDHSCQDGKFQSSTFRDTREEGGKVLVLEVYGNAFGNGKYTVELTGMEMAALLEMLCPQLDNPLQMTLWEQFSNAVGAPLSNFMRMATHIYGGLRCRCGLKNTPFKCVRKEGDVLPLDGITKTKGSYYEVGPILKKS